MIPDRTFCVSAAGMPLMLKPFTVLMIMPSQRQGSSLATEPLSMDSMAGLLGSTFEGVSRRPLGPRALIVMVCCDHASRSTVAAACLSCDFSPLMATDRAVENRFFSKGRIPSASNSASSTCNKSATTSAPRSTSLAWNLSSRQSSRNTASSSVLNLVVASGAPADLAASLWT